VASDESNPHMQPNTEADIETPEMESHPNIPQEEQPPEEVYMKTTTASY